MASTSDVVPRSKLIWVKTVMMRPLATCVLLLCAMSLAEAWSTVNRAAVVSSPITDGLHEPVGRRGVVAGLTLVPVLLSGRPAHAEEFVRQTDQLSYRFVPPPDFEAGNKPLRTHLDEINFKSSNRSGYQIGITVDPVRIASLADFGTPEEVAAKVVLAEVNRDGVFDVTLMKDPVAGDGFYLLNYLSEGKRGRKRFVAKFYITKQKLYAMTAQCKEDDYTAFEKEIAEAVDSFQPI